MAFFFQIRRVRNRWLEPSLKGNTWVFPEMGVSPKWMVYKLIKMDDLGVPPFKETPIISFQSSKNFVIRLGWPRHCMGCALNLWTIVEEKKTGTNTTPQIVQAKSSLGTYPSHKKEVGIMFLVIKCSKSTNNQLTKQTKNTNIKTQNTNTQIRHSP